MRPPTASELLIIWENGFEQTNIEKAVALLATISRNSKEEVAKWSVEERDIKLFYLRWWMFGDRFTNIATCPSCHEKVEWEMNIKDFSLPVLPLSLKQKFQFEIKNYTIQFRLPTSEDLILLKPKKILHNCLLEVKKGNEIISSSILPKIVVEAINEEMEKISSLSSLFVRLNCPTCQHQWQMNFDILSYLWREIDNWAKKLLQEIYLLANTFKWSESDILNMSARRRQFYIEMIQA